MNVAIIIPLPIENIPPHSSKYTIENLINTNKRIGNLSKM
jgi:hypothetical protein